MRLLVPAFTGVKTRVATLKVPLLYDHFSGMALGNSSEMFVDVQRAVENSEDVDCRFVANQVGNTVMTFFIVPRNVVVDLLKPGFRLVGPLYFCH